MEADFEHYTCSTRLVISGRHEYTATSLNIIFVYIWLSGKYGMPPIGSWP